MRLIALLIVCWWLCGCTDDPQQPQNEVSTTASAASPAEVSSRAAAASSKAATEQQNLDQFIAGVLSKMDKIPSNDLDGRLSVIVTAYCTAMRAGLEPEVETSLALSKLYDENWRAGGKWNADLTNAAQQQGGCPTPASPTDNDG